MDNGQPDTQQATPLPDSPWLGRAVTDHLGRHATVRGVYEVGGQHVAVLTSTLPVAQGGEAICGEHVDLLSSDGQAPAFPGFRDKLNRLGDLEGALHSAGATEDDARAFSALRRTLAPYQQAEYRLKQALIDQMRPGDRIYLTGKGWYATLEDLDDDPLRDLPRMALRIRLDDAALQEAPSILERHPDGVIELSTLMMWPTLDLA